MQSILMGYLGSKPLARSLGRLIAGMPERLCLCCGSIFHVTHAAVPRHQAAEQRELRRENVCVALERRISARQSASDRVRQTHPYLSRGGDEISTQIRIAAVPFRKEDADGGGGGGDTAGTKNGGGGAGGTPSITSLNMPPPSVWPRETI